MPTGVETVTPGPWLELGIPGAALFIVLVISMVKSFILRLLRTA